VSSENLRNSTSELLRFGWLFVGCCPWLGGFQTSSLGPGKHALQPIAFGPSGSDLFPKALAIRRIRRRRRQLAFQLFHLFHQPVQFTGDRADAHASTTLSEFALDLHRLDFGHFYVFGIQVAQCLIILV